MTDRIWDTGRPPSIGWWNASGYYDSNIWRWWDGERWSNPVSCHDPAKTAAKVAAQPSFNTDIRWSDYWPTRARVKNPRKPTKLHDKTPWYPGNVKPVRVGYYEVDNGGMYSNGGLHPRSGFYLRGPRRYWNGKQWRGGWVNEVVSIFGTHPKHRWRGFTTCQD